MFSLRLYNLSTRANWSSVSSVCCVVWRGVVFYRRIGFVSAKTMPNFYLRASKALISTNVLSMVVVFCVTFLLFRQCFFFFFFVFLTISIHHSTLPQRPTDFCHDLEGGRKSICSRPKCRKDDVNYTLLVSHPGWNGMDVGAGALLTWFGFTHS